MQTVVIHTDKKGIITFVQESSNHTFADKVLVGKSINHGLQYFGIPEDIQPTWSALLAETKPGQPYQTTQAETYPFSLVVAEIPHVDPIQYSVLIQLPATGMQVVGGVAPMRQVLPHGLVVMNDQGQIADINSKASNILSVSMPQLKGEEPFDEGWKAFLETGEQITMMEFPSRKVFNTKKPSLNSVIRVVNSATGHEKWTKIDSFPILNEKEEIQEVYCFLEDITQFKQQIEQIAQSETKLHRFINATPDVLLACNTNKEIVLSNNNAEQLFGLGQDAIIGKPLQELIPFDNWDTEAFEPLQKENKHFQKELGTDDNPILAQHISGTKFPVEVVVSSLIEKDNKTLIVSIKDITQKIETYNKLVESESRYKDLIEHSHEIIQSVDPSGQFQYVNDTWRSKLGYTEDDIKTLNLFDIIEEESLSHCIHKFKDVLQGESLHSMNITFKTKGGEKVYVQGSAIPRIIDGKVIATHTFFTDITDRIEKQQLIESLSRFPQENPLPVMRMSMTGELMYANQASYRTLGRVGLNDTESDLWQQFRAIINKVHAATGNDLQDTITINQRTFRISAHAVEEYQYVNIYVNDITDIVEADRRLKASEEKYRGIMENMELGLLEVDLDHTITKPYYWFCQLTGYTEEELIGQNALKLLIAEEYHHLILQQDDKRHKGEQSVYEVQLKHKKGHTIWVLISGSPVFNNDGELIGSIGIHYEITQLKELQQQLLESNQRLEALIDSQTTFIIRLDLKGELTYFNAKFEDEFSRNYPPNETITCPLPAIESSHHDIFLDAIQQAQQHPGEIVRMELAHPANNTVKTSLWEMVCFTDNEGNPSEIQASGIDISDRKMAEKILEQQNKMLREIALISSHETRRPIANIMGLVPLLERPNEESVYKKTMEYLKRDINSLDEVVRSIVRKIEEQEMQDNIY